MNISNETFDDAVAQAARAWETAWGITAQISPEVIENIRPGSCTLIANAECWILALRADWMDWMPVYYYYDTHMCVYYVNTNIMSGKWGNYIKTSRMKNTLVVAELNGPAAGPTVVAKTIVYEFQHSAL